MEISVPDSTKTQKNFHNSRPTKGTGQCGEVYHCPKLGIRTKNSVKIFLQDFEDYILKKERKSLKTCISKSILKNILELNFPECNRVDDMCDKKLLAVLQRYASDRKSEIKSMRKILDLNVKFDMEITDHTSRIKNLFHSLAKSMTSLGLCEESNVRDDITLPWKEQKRRLLKALPTDLKSEVNESLNMVNGGDERRNLFKCMIEESKQWEMKDKKQPKIIQTKRPEKI